ncbi:MAG: hypothetical protein LBV69_09600 [Bacteroidales bacterium]|jgi:hypothetical protein|nr:hypothetical protein [Bacteroidales bacterium]
MNDLEATKKPEFWINPNFTLNIYSSLELQEGMSVRLDDPANNTQNIDGLLIFRIVVGENVTIKSNGVVITSIQSVINAAYRRRVHVLFTSGGSYNFLDNFFAPRTRFYNGKIHSKRHNLTFGSFCRAGNNTNILDIQNSTITITGTFDFTSTYFGGWTDANNVYTWMGWRFLGNNPTLQTTGSHIIMQNGNYNHFYAMPAHQYGKISFMNESVIHTALSCDTLISHFNLSTIQDIFPI